MPQPKSMAPRGSRLVGAAWSMAMARKPILIGNLAHHDLMTIGKMLRRKFPLAKDDPFRGVMERLSQVPFPATGRDKGRG